MSQVSEWDSGIDASLPVCEGLGDLEGLSGLGGRHVVSLAHGGIHSEKPG